MTGIVSNSAGVLLLSGSRTDDYVIIDLIDGTKQTPHEAKYLYSAAEDWEVIDAKDAEELTQIACREYWIERVVSLLRITISGIEEDVESELLGHIEEQLGERVCCVDVANRLLVAPFKDSRQLERLVKIALSKGLSSLASLLQEVNELQPNLRRLSDRWLAIDFSDYYVAKETIWLAIITHGLIKRILLTNNREEFSKTWNLLMFYFELQYRGDVTTVGQKLAEQLFPQDYRNGALKALFEKEYEAVVDKYNEHGLKAEAALERVEKEIRAIEQAVSEGNDTKAERFLQDLISEQVLYSGGEERAVKSLCNIAQKCAAMFRTDFEAICLNKAMQIQPYDSWTLVQYGDHLKRMANYDKALEVLQRAREFGKSEEDVVVSSSSIADVYSQQGFYEKAILVYQAISNWFDMPTVLTAIADNLRKMGDLKNAEVAYKGLIERCIYNPGFYESELRAQIGMAEIAKKQGRLADAFVTYRKIIDENKTNPDMVFYKMGFVNILKLMQKYADAYSVLDEVVRDYPFFMQARFIRGSVLGLIGKEQEGLRDLPESSGSRCWGEWIRGYYRGLLLLKLDRHEDARKNLVDELTRAIASGEEKSILRMGAAFWYLKKGENHQAEQLLSEVKDLHDYHTSYLLLVLKLHLAAQKKDTHLVDLLNKEIARLQISDGKLQKAVDAINQRNFALAAIYEADALLAA